MAKNMARIENGVVINIEWFSDNQEQTESLIDLADRPAGIGDSYIDGKFYRNGVEILTPIEEYQKLLQNAEIAYEKGVNSI
jgi:hypothetical protein